MKKSGVFVASMAAASASAISASSPNSSSSAASDFFYSSKIQPFREEGVRSKGGDDSSSQGSSPTDKFAPRFDGLRFIETLVTAHR